MKLPRWTAYLSLAVLTVFLVTAVPKRVPRTQPANAPAASKPAKKPRIVGLGIDGMDPEMREDVMRRYPDRMQNFRKLASEGTGVRALGTSTPPQSPVAWSNFITGRNPGGHGVFDFIHRNPETYAPASSTVTEVHGSDWNLPGEWKFPSPFASGGDSNRTGMAFWTRLGENGVPSDVWRMPINFPVESAQGWSFPGMMTPTLDSAYGEFTFYSTDPPAEREFNGGKIIEVQERSGVIRTSVYGPPNAFKKGDPQALAPLTIYIDEEAKAVLIDTGTDEIILEAGEWSDFARVNFSLLPMGAMDMSGIVRFYLRSMSPEFELYASPINFDPAAPVEPVSYPDDAAVELADAIGDYYTQGMAEEVSGLKTKVISDDEFMRQADLVYKERNRMLDYALERYADNEDGGLLFFYYSTVDLCGHMMWRHQDTEHPAHDAEIAGQSSTWWTEREGSTWRTVIDDLYLKMDPVLGRVRASIGEDTPIMVMSDHGFAPFRRLFNLNTWLLEEGYLVLNEGMERELPVDDPAYQPVHIFGVSVSEDEVDADGNPKLIDDVDWSKTRAYGMGFNGLYLNLKGRESKGIVEPGAEADALIAELKAKLEDVMDGDTRVVLNADVASVVYTGERLSEAPEILVGYNSGYGNSDASTQGQIPHAVLEDNLGGTFNGSHLMDPRVVSGVLVCNSAWGELALDDPRLEDLTVEIFKRYGLKPDPAMVGRPVFK